MADNSSDKDTEFLMRLPAVVAPQQRFVLEGISTALFSVEASYQRLHQTLCQYDNQTIFALPRNIRALIFSDVWNIIDNVFMASRLLSAFLSLQEPDEQSDKTVTPAPLESEIRDKIRLFLDNYEQSISDLRNMKDHLHSNIKRISESETAAPIQGGLSYVLCSPENHTQKTFYIVMLTNNALTQDTCDIVLANPVGQHMTLPVDHVLLTATNKQMKNTVVEISKLYQDSVHLRAELNEALETPTYSALKEYAAKNDIPIEKLVESKAHSITQVLASSFGENNEQES